MPALHLQAVIQRVAACSASEDQVISVILSFLGNIGGISYAHPLLPSIVILRRAAMSVSVL